LREIEREDNKMMKSKYYWVDGDGAISRIQQSSTQIFIGEREREQEMRRK